MAARTKLPPEDRKDLQIFELTSENKTRLDPRQTQQSHSGLEGG